MLFQVSVPYSQFGGQFYNLAVRFGFYDVILPFLLIFTVIYATMVKAKILGENKRIQMVISLALALTFLYPHFAGIQPDPVALLNAVIPNVTVLAIAIVLFLILLGLVGIEFGGILQMLAVLASLIAVGFFFLLALGYRPIEWIYQYFPALLDPQVQDLAIIILIFGIIVWFVVREPDAQTDVMGGIENFLKRLVGKQP
ncbi:MAG: hypothetical protein AABX52_01600 [Nanoarchaeota archaeon]